jgi:dTDP-4-amino-4,6-dideoxygalactose transaminase
LPETERIAAEILSLPMFPGLTPAAQQRVADAIRANVPVTAAR